jgi:hypothetical protein
MHLHLQPVSLFMFVLLWSYVAWNWVRWLRAGEKERPTWRIVVIVAGLCFATISTILSAFLYIHAVITGGYPFYDPVELFCIRAGALTALLGLAASFAGKGKLRLSVAVISTLNLLLWYIAGMAQ